MTAGRPSKLLTTSIVEVREQPNVKVFLEKKSRNSPNSASTYSVGLARLQDFLNQQSYDSVQVNDIESLFTQGKEKNVYEFLDKFVSYLSKEKISNNSVRLYIAAIRSYLVDRDIEINLSRFKNKVTMPKNHREDEEAIEDADIRKILLACNNRRLKTYLLILVSGGFRALEALSIRLKDIDFSVTPTKIHIRKEFTKTKVARDIYISEEATVHLKNFIDWKYRDRDDRPERTKVKSENDLVFRIRISQENPAKLYTRIMKDFQHLLKSIGLDERKEGGTNDMMKRRKITLHSFRRFCKTTISNHASPDYSEWFLGHQKSPYYVQSEKQKRLLYATKCMPFLTFLNYSKLEQDANVRETEVEMLQIKDANKDREIELLKEKLAVKDNEIKVIKQRDAMSTDAISSLANQLQQLTAEVKELKDKEKERESQ